MRFSPKQFLIGDHIRIQEGSQETFSGTLTVLERRGERFVPRFDLPNNTREIHGTIKDGRISWLAKDVKVIENHGHQGHDHFGNNRGRGNLPELLRYRGHGRKAGIRRGQAPPSEKEHLAPHARLQGDVK